MPKKIKITWDKYAREDLKKNYKFNKKTFSKKFALRIRDEIYDTVGNITFLDQWQKDEITGKSYRRIIVRHYKIVYKIKSKDSIFVLMIFDTRQEATTYKL